MVRPENHRLTITVNPVEYDYLIRLMDMRYTNTLSQGVKFLMQLGISKIDHKFEEKNNVKEKK